MTVLVVTGTGTGVGKTVAVAALACHARQAGIDVAVCKPVQTGTDSGDDDLAEVSRLSGVTEIAGLARYPQPLAPRGRGRAGRDGPAHPRAAAAVHSSIWTGPGRLTLVEGAGGLLVELADAGVTLRDLAVDLGAAVLVTVTAELGTLNHTALTLESVAGQHLSCAGLVIGSWPRQPGLVETSNRSALDRLAPVRAALPAGAGSMDVDDFATMSAAAFDRNWVTALVALMVHSIELVFDSDTEAAIRRIWDDLAGAGIPSQAPASRPHVTLAVAESISADVDELLRALNERLPLGCAVGAPVLFGRATAVFARLIVPTGELLALHADVHRLCLPYLVPAPMPNSCPASGPPTSRWPAVSTARSWGARCSIAGRPAQIDGRFAGLRRWDGNKRIEHLL